MGCKPFPVITKGIQADYERTSEGKPDGTPEICGYYGRACRQLEKPEGANRALCQRCPLIRFHAISCAE